MLRHLTTPAWDALERARGEAGRRGAEAIAPEHLLLGLLAERANRACQALARCGVVLDEVATGARSAAGADVGGAELARAEFDGAARRVLEHAAAMSRGGLDSGHLLKALARDRASRASRVLAALGADGPAVDRAVSSLAGREAEGPAIDESDPLFDAMEMGTPPDGADRMDAALASLGRTDDYARALALAVRPPRRTLHWPGDALLGWCGVADLASIAVVLTALAEFGVAQGLGPDGWSTALRAVPFAGLVALAAASVSMLAAAGFGLWSALRASQRPDAHAVLAKVSRWLALGVVGTCLGGAPGAAVLWRQLAQAWTGGLAWSAIDWLPLWSLAVIALHLWAWRVHRARRRDAAAVQIPARISEPSRDERAR